MKQKQKDVYTIAWFKIAECVARGEKERALGVYRLLSHSINDVALKYQIEGDILWAFDDGDASSKYRQAAQEYKKSDRSYLAAAVYEHMLLLETDTIQYQKELITIYKNLAFNEKYALRLLQACQTLLNMQRYKEVEELVIEHEKDLEDRYKIRLCEMYLIAQASDKKLLNGLVEQYIKQVVHWYLDHGNLSAIEQLRTQLQEIEHSYAQFLHHFFVEQEAKKHNN